MGYYVGPALDHYRCHKILKTLTSAVIISDTVVFQHPTLSVPTLTTTNRIIHCLWALTIAVRADRTPDSCNAQLLAVESLRAIFNSNLNRPTPDNTQALPPTTQIARQATLPRVSVTQPTAPRVVATLPRVAVAPPRVAALHNPPTDIQLIAHRTRLNRDNANSIAVSAHAALQVTFSLPADHIDKSTLSRDTQYNLSLQWNTVPSHRIESTFQPPRNRVTPPTTSNRFALLADTIHDDEIPTDTIVDVDAAQTLPMFIACPVLDHETGQTLEHGQLRRHPKYKATWDESYADEIFRLCQGGGKHPTKPDQQRIQGTNTMRSIMFHDIPHDQKGDIAHTRVVCEVRPTKADPNCTRVSVTIGGNTINYIGDCGNTTASLETVKLVVNSTLSTPDADIGAMVS